MVRVTFDLDDSLARAVQQQAAAQAISFTEALNRLLQRAVDADGAVAPEAPLFCVIQDLFKGATRERTPYRHSSRRLDAAGTPQ